MTNNVPPGPDDARLRRRLRKFERHVVEEIQLTDTVSARAEVRRARWEALRFAAAWVGLWALLAAAGLFVRQPWPSDETRLLGIAWEMWARGDFRVAYLNGQPELHPPLFFWFIHLGWLFGGVSEWWARLVPALGALASLIVVQRLAGRLWSEESELKRYAPLLLLGTLAFALISGLTLPDTWLLAFTLLSFWGLSIQWRAKDHRAWMLTACGLAGAVLTSGLIVFVYFLPLALLAPLWARSPKPEWKHWYADMLKAVFAAFVVGGLWLALAGMREGWPHVVRFLSHNWKGLPLEMFERNQPWWWYGWVAPLVVLPWSVLPLAWMRLWHIRREPLDGGFVFCLVWFVVPLMLLSLLPIKQPQYLLAVLPAGVLLASRLLLANALHDVYEDKPFAGMAIPVIMVGGVLMVLPRLPRVEFLPDLLWQQSPLVGLAVMGVGIATAWLPIKDVRRRVFDIAALAVLLVVLGTLGVGSQFNRFFPIAEVAQVIANAQAAGRPVAYVGEYHGEYHFAGRLRAPLATLEGGNGRVEAWAAAYPEGIVITPADVGQPSGSTKVKPIFETTFRDGVLRVYDARQILPP